MSTSDDKSKTSLGLVIGYIFFVAITTLVVYRLASVWVGHCVLLLLLLAVPLWLASPKSRRLSVTSWLIAALTLFGATKFIQFLNTPEHTQAIEQNAILRFFLGGVTAQTVISILLALTLSISIVFIPLLIVLYISSEWVLHMPEVGDISRVDIMRLFFSVIFHTRRPYYLVENGEITQTKPKGLLPKIGGPGLVIIKPYNAVVFERGGVVTRIEGPGRVLTDFMEFAKEAFDLRKQWISWTAENVLTKDHVPLRFHCGVGFRIEAAKDTAKWVPDSLPEEEGGHFLGIISGDYKVYQHTLYRAAYGTTAAGWKLTSRAATETQLLNVVRGYSLDDFYRLEDGDLVTDESIIDTIVQETLSRVSKISHNWGVTISGFKISHFEAPEEMKDQLLEMWVARYEEKSKILEAQADKEMMVIRSEGIYRSMILEASARKEATVIQAEGARQSIITKGEGQAKALAYVEGVKTKAIAELIDQLLRGIQAAEKVDLDPAVVQRFAQVIEQISGNLVRDNLTALRYIEALEKIALSDAPKTIAFGNLTLESTMPTLPDQHSR